MIEVDDIFASDMLSSQPMQRATSEPSLSRMPSYWRRRRGVRDHEPCIFEDVGVCKDVQIRRYDRRLAVLSASDPRSALPSASSGGSLAAMSPWSLPPAVESPLKEIRVERLVEVEKIVERKVEVEKVVEGVRFWPTYLCGGLSGMLVGMSLLCLFWYNLGYDCDECRRNEV
jgi:hypothetical protein